MINKKIIDQLKKIMYCFPGSIVYIETDQSENIRILKENGITGKWIGRKKKSEVVKLS